MRSLWGVADNAPFSFQVLPSRLYLLSGVFFGHDFEAARSQLEAFFMHKSSYEHMAACAGQFLDGNKPLSILDIGSYDVNGSYRPVFDRPGWQYRGVDLAAGPNVDLVLESPYRLPLASRSVDVVVSGQAFEHVPFFWLSWLEMVRVVKPGGHIFLIAPSRGPEHRYPEDCWRFYPDGFQALAAWGRVHALSIHTDWTPHHDADSALWGDTVGVFQVPEQSLWTRCRAGLICRLAQRLVPGC
ncbi:methyltransferase domain-containing protein [Chitinilyticum aquatile]|uniref:methyltransferase domain-containing protein n=1 Tax=Chitinilyticum aquatile TaxID=362520 RepID=UPI001B7FE334|nr:class I SAM-dependent methyltransferase [Chitinilyticum aquatile]